MYKQAIVTSKKNIKQLAFTLNAIDLKSGNNYNHLNNLYFIRYPQWVTERAYNDKYTITTLNLIDDIKTRYIYEGIHVDTLNIAISGNDYETTGGVDLITISDKQNNILETFYVYFVK